MDVSSTRSQVGGQIAISKFKGSKKSSVQADIPYEVSRSVTPRWNRNCWCRFACCHDDIRPAVWRGTGV